MEVEKLLKWFCTVSIIIILAASLIAASIAASGEAEYNISGKIPETVRFTVRE